MGVGLFIGADAGVWVEEIVLTEEIEADRRGLAACWGPGRFEDCRGVVEPALGFAKDGDMPRLGVGTGVAFADEVAAAL